MNIALACVGRQKERYLREAEDDYRKRLRPYCRLDVIEARTEPALLAALPDRARVWALDERGALLTSEQLAAMLGDEATRGGGAPVVFAVGGPDGHTDALRARAQRTIAFGRLTIAHRLVRVLVLEQIYRAFRILRGEPYHRG